MGEHLAKVLDLSPVHLPAAVESVEVSLVEAEVEYTPVVVPLPLVEGASQPQVVEALPWNHLSLVQLPGLLALAWKAARV